MNSDTSINISKTNPPFFGSWSIQLRLILLVLMSVLPALGIILHTGFEDKKNDVEDAKTNILQTVENLARLQNTITASTKQLLMNIAQYPEVQNGDVHACNRLFKSLLMHSLYDGNIIAARPDGKVFAAGTANTSFSQADRDYFQQALATRDFVVGGYVVARPNNVPSLPFAFPVMNDQDQIKGMVVATVRLDQYENFLHQMGFPEGSIVGIEDRNGIRLCRFPKLDEEINEGIGHPLPRKIWQIVSGSQKKGTYAEEGVDGIRRIYGFVQLRLKENDRPYLYIRVGIPEKRALSPANIRLSHNLFLFGIASFFALAAAYFLGNLTIANPLKKLVDVSRQMGTGNFNLRSGISYMKGGEIGLLAQSFDTMASALKKREVERKESEESIRQLNRQNQMILDAAGEGIVGLDSQGMVTFINPAAAAMTGYAVHELLGQDLHRMIHHSFPDGSDYHLNQYPMNKANAFETSNGEGDEVLWRKDGTSFSSAYSITPIVENGKRLGTVKTFRDITKNKRMEENLRESERRYREIFNNVSEGLYMLEVTDDRRFRFIEQNTAMAQSTKIPHEEIVGKYADEIKSDPIGQITIALCHRCMEEGTIIDEEIELKLPSGNRYYSTSFIPLRDSKGTIYRLVGISRDITNHKQLEKELFMAKKLEIIGQLAGGVAHEVRNPLNAILSITEALFTEKDIADNKDYQPYIEHIRTQVNRLSKLMTDLLDLGKPIKPTNVHFLSLIQLCTDTIKLWELTKAAHEHPVSLACIPVEYDPWVHTDGMHLQQALLNLMDNAAQCSPAGKGIELTITQKDNSKVCIEIRDNGTGVPPQRIEQIFEPFFTLTRGGTGLGLTLVKHFIESLGGEIKIRNNEPSPGCTAELMLHTARREDFES